LAHTNPLTGLLLMLTENPHHLELAIGCRWRVSVDSPAGHCAAPFPTRLRSSSSTSWNTGTSFSLHHVTSDRVSVEPSHPGTRISASQRFSSDNVASYQY